MDKNQINILKKEFNLEINEAKAKIFSEYEKLFLEKNAFVNLISKNDEKFLFEKHIFDSLAIAKKLGNPASQPLNSSPTQLLDIGTGGGFPSVPVAIFYDNIEVYAIDSIRKKINVIESLKADLDLKNLFPICERVEKLPLETTPKEYDYITSRAVAPMDMILKYAFPHLKKGGLFIAYKSKKALDELKDAEKTLKRLGGKIVEIIEYTLPLEEVFERNLIVIKKG